MRDFLTAARMILVDMAAALLFLLLLEFGVGLTVAVATGMLLGALQIAWEYHQGRPVDTLQWVSLVVILSSGSATLLTRDPRFILVKPSVVYGVIGVTMLQRGWMTRYLPARARQLVPDLGVAFGYVWAGLMFVSAAVNLGAAVLLTPLRWAAFMTVFATGSKISLFLLQYGCMRLIGRRRLRAAGGILPGEPRHDIPGQDSTSARR